MTLMGALKKARGYLVKYGWIKNDLGDRGRGYCAVGALDAVDRDHGVDFTHRALKVLAGQLRGADMTSIDVVTYNNATRRTKKQMLALFDKAIKACKS